MASTYSPGKTINLMERIEKQLFKDAQKLIRHINDRKSGVGRTDHQLMEFYERRVLERFEVLGEIARR